MAAEFTELSAHIDGAFAVSEMGMNEEGARMLLRRRLMSAEQIERVVAAGKTVSELWDGMGYLYFRHMGSGRWLVTLRQHRQG